MRPAASPGMVGTRGSRGGGPGRRPDARRPREGFRGRDATAAPRDHVHPAGPWADRVLRARRLSAGNVYRAGGAILTVHRGRKLSMQSTICRLPHVRPTAPLPHRQSSCLAPQVAV